MKKKNTISLRMNLQSEVHSLILLLVNGNPQGMRDARERLMSIAQTVDRHNMSIDINTLEEFLTSTIPVLKANPDIDTCYPVDYESALVELCDKCHYNWEREEFSTSKNIEQLDNVQVYEHFLSVVDLLKERNSA